MASNSTLSPIVVGVTYKDVKPYLTLPAWWRRFIFCVLSPRDFVVYVFICSYMLGDGVAAPNYEEIKAATNLSNGRDIKKSLERLKARGFLDFEERAVDLRGRTAHERNVYQRMSVAFTMLQLLQNGYINEDFMPLKMHGDRGEKPRSKKLLSLDRGLIQSGLRSLLGPSEAARISGLPGDEKRKALIEALTMIVQRQRAGLA